LSPRHAALALLFLAGCGGNAVKPGPSPLYYRMYEETKPEKIGALTPGGPEEAAALDRFAQFFGNLNERNVRENLRKTYADKLYFNDTLKEISDVDALEHYLLDTAANVESCTVTIHDVVSKNGDYYVRWEMFITFKKFRKGEVQPSIGITHLRFDKDGRIVFHQDYWDAAANLFEKVPVVGWMIRKIKKRL
jgi:hypothetical protein